jgi:aminopeptidase N
MNVTTLHVSEWVMHAGVKVRVYCPLGQANEGKYALSIAVRALDLFAAFS